MLICGRPYRMMLSSYGVRVCARAKESKAEAEKSETEMEWDSRQSCSNVQEGVWGVG